MLTDFSQNLKKFHNKFFGEKLNFLKTHSKDNYIFKMIVLHFSHGGHL